MPSEHLLRSIRRWLVVVAGLLGLALVALASIGYELSGATEGTLYAVLGIAGGVVALAAALRWVAGLAASAPEPVDD
ncbi:hypothetical protein [Halorarius halobius]|uniref:hypothetical protein n=1 Tax=Halorarius halobius TaxID=2962671 RepID=UPI0020CB98AB|nr:hypothetical protein [Halorarius halobius]